MSTADSNQLLRDYAERRDEQAFGELVRRYIELVHSTALRRVNGDAHLAQDIAQRVFLDLARKAGALPCEIVLGGWLYQHTCFTVANTLRTERRRRAREMEAATMRAQIDDADAAWRQVAPLLDGAMNRLSQPDVNALVLRFFEGQPLREVGRALGISEDAARMRVNRALEQLRRLLSEQGLKLSTVGLAVMLADEAVASAPTSVARGIAAMIASSTVSASISALSLGKTLLLMAKLKMKTLVVGGTATLALIYAGSILYNSLQGSKLGQAESTMTQALVNATNRSRGFRAPVIGISANASLEALLARLRAALREPDPSNEEVMAWYDTPNKMLGSGRFLDGFNPDDAISALKIIYWHHTATNLIRQFGEHEAAAFLVLKEAVEEAMGDTSAVIYRRAVAAMSSLKRSVPGLRPFLWELEMSAPGRGGGSQAFAVLQGLGFDPPDLPALAELLIRQPFFAVPAIEQVLTHDREAAKPYLSAVEQLLDYPGIDLRFNAALALAKSEAKENPKVLDVLLDGLTDRSKMSRSLAILRDLGPAAQAALPRLVDLAKSWNVTDYDARSYGWSANQRVDDRLDLFQTVDTLSPELKSQWPELAQALKDGEESQQWNAKWKSADYTLQDLQTAIQNPHQTGEAARRLQQLGPDALEAVPVLLDALAGPHRTNEKDQIVAALRAIDPQVKIPRVESRSVTDALTAAQQVLQSSHEPDAALRRELNRTWLSLGNGATWWTERELTAFSRDLSARHASAHRAFVAKLLGRDPRLKEAIEPASEP